MIALDLFSGAGGAAIGLKRAGFYVIGVDIKTPSNYYGDEFIRADVHNLPFKDVLWADFVWASPPCQLFSIAGKYGDNDWERHPNLIPITRRILKGHPYTVIENVVGSPIRKDVILTGLSVFCLDECRLDRRRHFETSFFMMFPPVKYMPRWKWEKGIAGTITKSMSSSSHFYNRKANGLPGSIPNWEAKEIMGIPAEHKMTNAEIGEAVPPRYSEFIAREAIRQMRIDS